MNGTGMIVNHDGYLRIKKRGALRDQMAHRAYVARQIGLKILPSHLEVDHQCGNRACWPPTDFHLVLVDATLAPHMYKTFGEKKAKRRGHATS